MCVQMFSADTLRELDASAYEEAPPLSPEEIAEETGRPSSDTGHPSLSDRSLGSRRRSLGDSPLSLSCQSGRICALCCQIGLHVHRHFLIYIIL